MIYMIYQVDNLNTSLKEKGNNCLKLHEKIEQLTAETEKFLLGLETITSKCKKGDLSSKF